MKTTRRGRRLAFTLIELLVVMAIIGMLAAILIPTINIVRIRAKNARIALEMNQLVAAVEGYKMKYGDYPPDFSNYEVVKRHIGKAFPRISSAEWDKFRLVVWGTTTPSAATPSRIDPAEALYFWLGGLSANVKEPFTGEGGPIKFIVIAGTPTATANPDRNAPQYEFDEGRLTQEMNPTNGAVMSTDEGQLNGEPNTDPFPAYLPPYLKKTPYVYFDSRTYIHNPVNGAATPPPRYPRTPPPTSSVGVARPYRTDTLRQTTPNDQVPFKWANEKTYQIVCAGLDNDFGADTLNPPGKLYPSGENYSLDPAADEDNLCNFSEGRTLGDSRP